MNGDPLSSLSFPVRSYFEQRGRAAAEKFFLRNALAAYKPVDRGLEKELAARLAAWKKWREQQRAR